MKEVICSAPGRIALVGNPFDIYGGMTIAMTLKDLRSIVHVKENEVEQKIHSDIFKPGNQRTKQRRQLELATLETLDLQHHTLEHYDGSNMPYESSLARSTAVVVAMIRAYSQLFGRGTIDQYDLAEQAWVTERKLGVCGGQERYAISFDDERLNPDELQDFLKRVRAGEKVNVTRPGKTFYMDFTGREDHHFNGHNFAKIRQLAQIPAKFAIAFQASGAKLNSFSIHQRLRELYVNDAKAKARIHAYRDESNEVTQKAFELIGAKQFDASAFGQCMTASLNIRVRMMDELLGEELQGQPLCAATADMIEIARNLGLKGYNQPGSKSLGFIWDKESELRAFEEAGYKVIRIINS